MAYYAIKNTAGVGAIPIFETPNNQIDATAPVVIRYEGSPSSSQPVYILNDSIARPNVSYYKLGNAYYLHYFRDSAMSSLSQDGLFSGGDNAILCAVRHKDETHDDLYFYAYYGDVDTFVTRYNDGLGINGLLFQGSFSSYASNIEEIREWDESPETDGDNTEDVEGGANADTDPFDFTQSQSVWPDPDADFISPYATDGQGNPIPGLYTPYELTPTQLQALGAVLYDSDMFDTLVQKLNGSSNPISGILRCIQIPVVTNLGSGSFNIAVFGEELHSENHANPTGAHLRGRWVTKNGGSVTLKEVWGTARDYTDTQVSIYLPFVGVRQLDPQLCVGKTLELRCYIDAYTGDVLWLLRSSNAGIGGKFFESGGFIGRWSGNCATEIPIGRIDNTRALATLIGGLSGVVMAPLTGGASLGATGASIAGMLTGGAQSMGVVSGNVTGHLGTADVLYPYLIVQRSVPDYPKSWRAKIGATKNDTYQANALTGYTLFSQIFLENMEGASGEEIEALKNELCSEGIIL
ncbi:MAG: hypothetical protein J6Q89_01700 [Clostridia bacterium]|nr:hypothetical protein [Clostridia bacterium]